MIEALTSNDAGNRTAPGAWTGMLRAAALLAIDPAGMGGASLRSPHGPLRDRWLAYLQSLLRADIPLRRVPAHVSDDRLLGGLDLAATLRSRRPIVARGLLAEVNEGIAILAMAERIAAPTIAKIVASMDAGEIVLERDGLAERHISRFGIVALDEGLDAEERPAAALLDRLAFHLDLSTIEAKQKIDNPATAAEIAAARAIYPEVRATKEIVVALCTAAMALGISSFRAPLLTLRVARAIAALAGRMEVAAEDAKLAAGFVLAPRATMLPASDQAPPEESAADSPPPDESDVDANDGRDDHSQDSQQQTAVEDVVLAAARAAIPPGLLAQLTQNAQAPRRSSAAGRSGWMQQASKGRPVGVRHGRIGGGARLNVVETLRAAAPWQRLRRDAAASAGDATVRVYVDAADFRITRYQHRSTTTTIFMLDASGSSAMQRLAEAKGAIELLLGESYARRDQVAVIAFRGRAAEIVLPPTRALARAKRTLAGLPGGGGTPLAAGIDAGATLAESLRRRGVSPMLVLLTDGKANVARNGAGGRPQAESDALAAARRVRAAGFNALLVDTSQRPQAAARQLAVELGARYVPLPYADPANFARSVQSARRQEH